MLLAVERGEFDFTPVDTLEVPVCWRPLGLKESLAQQWRGVDLGES